MALTAGTRLGPYEILGLIGAGGMGEVYKARDTRLDRTVAIKVLPNEISSDPDRRARFEREARTIATLSHPHICTLHDVGEQSSSLFLVMEYLEGQTLAERLRKGPLPIEQALDIGAQIAEALSAAHRAGIIHRDLKPANVMLTKAGVKLLDFGLAKVRPQAMPTAASRAGMPTETEPLTGRGTILGTLPYMAPEQLEGKESDARTDMWAFGLVLYETLTGKRAFDGGNPASVITAIMSTVPTPPSALQPLSPPLLDRIVSRCLQKDPDRRWQNAADCADELRWVGSAPDEGKRRPVPRIRPATIGVLLAGLMAVAFLWSRTPVRISYAGPVSRVTISVAASGLTLTDGGLAISPDGRTVVFAARSADDISRLYARQLDEWDPRPLKGTEGAVTPFFSPDGDSVAFVSGGILKKTRLDDGTPQTIARVQYQGISRGDWTRDGHIYLSNWPGALLAIAADGGAVPKPVGSDSPAMRYLWPQLLPGGNTLLFTTTAKGHSSLAAVSLATGSVRRVLDSASCGRYVPSGHLLYASEGHLCAVPFDPFQLKTAGQSRIVIDDISVGELWSTVAFAYDVSPSGTMAYVPAATARTVLVWKDRAGRTTPLNLNPRVYAFPSLSPDGRHVAVTVYDWPATNVWTGSIQGEPLNQLTSSGGGMCSIFSRDGRWVVFTSRDEGGWFNLSRVPADGSGEPERLFTARAHQKPSSFVAGDDLLFNEAGAGGNRDIILTNTSRRGSRSLVVGTSANEIEAAVSPDGKWMAYQSDESGHWEIYVRPFSDSGPRQRVSIDGGLGPKWNPRGGELFYQTRDSLVAVRVIDGTVRSQPTKLFPLRTQDYRRQYDVTPDGEHFLVMESATSRTDIYVITNWFEELKAKVPTK